PGSDVGYTVTVTNNGPAYAGAVRIQDTAPDGTSIASWTARVEAGTVNLPGTSGAGELDQTIRILPAGATVTYDITLNTSEANTADLVNTVTVSTETDDAVPSNNTASTAPLPSVPAAPTSGGDLEACAESPVQTLTATAAVPAGQTVVWYDAATGGNVVTDPTLNTVGTVTYYAEAVKGELVSATRTAVTLTIHALPVLVITDPAVACAGATVDLTAAAVTAGSDAGLTYTYYRDAAGIDELTAPEAVAASGTYYIRATDPNTGCSTVAPVTVQFVDRPVVTATHPDCVVGTGSIAITEPLGVDFEYSINGVDYQSEPLFESVAPGTYGVTARHVSTPGCVSAEVEVTIHATPTTVTPGVVHPGCGESTGRIEFPANADYEYAVYQAGETPAYQSSPVFADLAPGEYLARMRSLLIDCELVAVTVTIESAPATPAAPVADDLTACAESPVQSLTATATVPDGHTIVWYDAATGGNVVADPTLDAVGTVTYYAEARNGDCVSETRTPVTLTLLETVEADAGADQTKAEGPRFTLDADLPAGATGTWSVVAGTPAVAISDINDPKATLSLTPGTSVTLRWTITRGSCEAMDEVVLTLLPAISEADLHVTATVNTSSPLAETEVVFTVEVRNEGPGNATAVEVHDKLPGGYAFVSAEASRGTYDAPPESGASVAWPTAGRKYCG